MPENKMYKSNASPLPSPYFSYLLRLWLAGDNDQPEWRLAVTDAQTDQTCGFASLEALTTFLQARMEETTPCLPPPNRSSDLGEVEGDR